MKQYILENYAPLGYLERVQDTSTVGPMGGGYSYHQKSGLYKNYIIDTINNNQLPPSNYHTLINLLMILVASYTLAQLVYYYHQKYKKKNSLDSLDALLFENEVNMSLHNELWELNTEIKDKEDNLFYKGGTYSHDDDGDEGNDDLV